MVSKPKMSLPPMARSNRYKARRMAEAIERGKLDAQAKAHKNKPLEESLKEHLGKMLDNAKLDPLEIAAITALTFIIKPMINNMISSRKILAVTIDPRKVRPWFWLLELVGAEIGNTLNEYFDGHPNDMYIWLISFVAAFLIVRWGDKMINAGIGSLEGIVGLAGLAVAA